MSYLKRIKITNVDKAFDGVQGLEKLKSKPPGYYSMILVGSYLTVFNDLVS